MEPRQDRYVELRCATAFSFLRGASLPEEIVERAAKLGYRRVGIADREGLYGVAGAHRAGKEHGVEILVGAEISLSEGSGLVLYATDRKSYGRLSRMLSVAKLRVGKGGFAIALDDVAAHHEGLLAIHTGTPDPFLLAREVDLFGDRLSLAIERQLCPFDRIRIEAAQSASARFGVPLVVTGGVLMHERQRKPLQDILSCIRMGVRLDQAGRRLLPNAAGHLKSPKEMAALFEGFDEALARSVEIADQCAFRLSELKHEFALEILPNGESGMSYLRKLVHRGAEERYPYGIPDDVQKQIDHELELIDQLGFAGYFLTVWDIVRWARSRGILCQGRGSAANSIVCYVLGITAIDPVRMSLLFERFISAERGEPPDIDVDFEHERREEVMQYVYEKYGRDHAAMVANVITYRGRSACREVGKVFGLSDDQIDKLSGMSSDLGLETWPGAVRDAPYREKGEVEQIVVELRNAGLDPEDPTVRNVIRYAREMCGLPRHLGIHSGGFLITRDPVLEIVPVENASMEKRTVIAWDKDDIEALGMLKIDLLALGMLTAVRRSFDFVRETEEGRQLTLAGIPAEDPAIYEMISDADTVGTFQIESRAQMQMLPKLKPRTFYDLVVSVAIIRPGPIQGDMIHPYLRRRDGLEPIEYPHPALVEILGKTYGVPLFQEQVMKIAVAVAGFTGGEADELRRAIGWHSQIHIDKLRDRLVDGMQKRGVSKDYAERVFRMIQGFGGYGFPESHAASFALIGYTSAYLKRYHPAAFLAALLNSQPMGFYSPHTLVADAQRHGVEVRPVSVLESGWESSMEAPDGRAAIEWWKREGMKGPARHTPWADRAMGRPSYGLPLQPAVRLGLKEIRGMSEAQARRIIEVRDQGGVGSIAELVARARIPRDLARRLAAAGAFNGLLNRPLPAKAVVEQKPPERGLERREAMWKVTALADPGTLFDGVELPAGDQPIPLAAMTDEERLQADYQTTGISVDTHPMLLLREEMRRQGILGFRELEAAEHGSIVRIAGVAITRQRPSTAGGVVFITLEDEHGHMNVVVFRQVFERCRTAARGAALLVVEGEVQRSGGVLNVIAREITPVERPPPSPPERHFVFFR